MRNRSRATLSSSHATPRGLLGWTRHIPSTCLVSSIFLFSIYAHLFYQFNETFTHTLDPTSFGPTTCRWKIFWDTKRLQLVRKEMELGTGQPAAWGRILVVFGKQIFSDKWKSDVIYAKGGRGEATLDCGAPEMPNARLNCYLTCTHTDWVGEVVKKKYIYACTYMGTPAEGGEGGWKSLTLEREYNWQLLPDSWHGWRVGGPEEWTDSSSWNESANLLNV